MNDNGLPEENPGENSRTEHEDENIGGKSLKKRAPRRFSTGVLVTVALLSILVTFMTTYVMLSQHYVKSINDYILSSQGDSEAFMPKLEAKLEKLDADIRSGSLFADDIDDEVLADSVLKGYMYGLGDKYAEYYNADEFSAMQDDDNGEMQGIGISIVFNSDYQALEVISVFPDSPAEKAGMEVGDMIAYVLDGEDYESVASLGYSKTVNLIRGVAGTTTDFIVFRGEGYSEQISFSIERGYVTEYTVSSWHYSLDDSVGIIRITSFDGKTAEQFSAALGKLLSDGVQSLVLDVRYNPGGELNSVCTVLDKLLPEGPVIRTVDREGNEEVVYTSDADETNLPMAVLVNGSTASAGELFSAALRDYNKAILVGTNTYGKGSMQTIKTFGDGTGIKYTFRYYCPPKTDNYDGVGLAPDVSVELSESIADTNFYKIADSDDNQLAAAVEALKK